jgi:hypothetical protein
MQSRSIAGAWPAKNPCELTQSRLVETEGLRASGLQQDEFQEQQEKTTPLGPDRHAGRHRLAATFLASDDARSITG